MYRRSINNAPRCAELSGSPGRSESPMGSSGQSRDGASKGRAKVGLEAGIGGIEQLTARDHHDVDALPARRRGGLAKNLTDQPLGAVSANGIPQLSRRNDTHSRSVGSIRRHDHRQIAALAPATGFKNLLKLGSASKPAGGGKAEGHSGPVGPVYYDDETVRRFRPFARRRFNTRRPFFVAILTRKPWVRRRRRLFGWKVRFMVSGPLSRRKTQRRNSNSNEPPSGVSIAGVAAKPPMHAGSWDFCRCCLVVSAVLQSLPLRGREAATATTRGPSGSFVGADLPIFQLRPSTFLWQPPEVFHNCGKKCGKAPGFRQV